VTSNHDKMGLRYIAQWHLPNKMWLCLSCVLRSKTAIHVNIQIMRAFTKMRQIIFDNAELHKEIEELRADTDGKFRFVFEPLDQLLTFENKPKKKIGFMAKEKQSENDRNA